MSMGHNPVNPMCPNNVFVCSNHRWCVNRVLPFVPIIGGRVSKPLSLSEEPSSPDRLSFLHSSSHSLTSLHCTALLVVPETLHITEEQNKLPTAHCEVSVLRPVYYTVCQLGIGCSMQLHHHCEKHVTQCTFH